MVRLGIDLYITATSHLTISMRGQVNIVYLTFGPFEDQQNR